MGAIAAIPEALNEVLRDWRFISVLGLVIVLIVGEGLWSVKRKRKHWTDDIEF